MIPGAVQNIMDLDQRCSKYSEPLGRYMGLERAMTF
jgi:hypothetical protein